MNAPIVEAQRFAAYACAPLGVTAAAIAPNPVALIPLLMSVCLLGVVAALIAVQKRWIRGHTVNPLGATAALLMLVSAWVVAASDSWWVLGAVGGMFLAGVDVALFWAQQRGWVQ